MVHHKFLLLSFVITLAAIQGIHAVDYDFTDTATNTTGVRVGHASITK